MKITLPNGMSLEGTLEQVRAAATALGYANTLGNDGVHYLSESRGLIPIASMDSAHIRNAILKIYREWVAGLSAEKDNAKLMESLRTGPRNNITLLALLSTLRGRV
jgi:hypothetical protein